jgi:ribosomal protein L16/L10AE
VIVPRVKRKNSTAKLKNRKKHIETMFLTQKQKKFPFYYKPSFNFSPNQSRFSAKPGLLYVRSLQTTYVELSVFKASARIIKWFIKKYALEDFLTFKFLAFPDFSLTSKPKDVRMGKGKGPVSKKVAFIRRGQFFVIFKLKKRPQNYFIFKDLVKQIISRLSFRALLTYKN